MRKTILALAAVLAAGSFAQIDAAEARGLRIGLGFGVPLGPNSFGRADPTILERAHRQNEINKRREAQILAGERRRAATSTISAAAERRRAAAAHAAKVKAERAEKVAAAKAAAKAAKETKAAKRIEAEPTPSQVARVPAAAPVASGSDNDELRKAQDQQRAKAEQLLKSLDRPAGKTAPVTTAAPAPAIVPVDKPVTKVSAPATPTKAPAAATGDCKRFVPGAGVTISVPCSE